MWAYFIESQENIRAGEVRLLWLCGAAAVWCLGFLVWLCLDEPSGQVPYVEPQISPIRIPRLPTRPQLTRPQSTRPQLTRPHAIRCTAITRKGRRCKNNAIEGTCLCRYHPPLPPPDREVADRFLLVNQEAVDLGETCGMRHGFVDQQQYDTDSNLPESIICPLTCCIMIDPVVDRDGNSYEREAIMKWLGQKQESPITRERLLSTDLITNRALRDMIRYYRENIIGSL